MKMNGPAMVPPFITSRPISNESMELDGHEHKADAEHDPGARTSVFTVRAEGFCDTPFACLGANHLQTNHAELGGTGRSSAARSAEVAGSNPARAMEKVLVEGLKGGPSDRGAGAIFALPLPKVAARPYSRVGGAPYGLAVMFPTDSTLILPVPEGIPGLWEGDIPPRLSERVNVLVSEGRHGLWGTTQG